MWLGEARVIPELRTQRSHIVEEKILEEKTPECHQQFFSGWWLMNMNFDFVHQIFLVFSILNM